MALICGYDTDGDGGSADEDEQLDTDQDTQEWESAAAAAAAASSSATAAPDATAAASSYMCFSETSSEELSDDVDEAGSDALESEEGGKVFGDVCIRHETQLCCECLSHSHTFTPKVCLHTVTGVCMCTERPLISAT